MFSFFAACVACVASSAEPDARPETWFHVIGGNVTQEGLSADLEAISEAGYGGIQFFHGAARDGKLWPGVKEPVECLSPKWDELVGFIAEECEKRGLTFKMQNCPGWSMSGGPWITTDKCMRKLVAFPPDGKPGFDADDDFHEICTLTFPLEDAEADSVSFPNPQQLDHGWAYDPQAFLIVTAGGREVFRRECPRGCWQDDASMTFRVPKGTIPEGELEFSFESAHGRRESVNGSVRREPRLDMWEAKAAWGLREFDMGTNAAPMKTKGTRTLVFGHVNMKRRNHPAPSEATGWECDKLAAAGFEANWDGYLGRLLKGPLAGGKLKGTLVDSWECGVQTWTWRMEEEFERFNGYKLRPWLPAIFGHVLESEAATERFLLDWRRTLSRLVEENYFAVMARKARENGMSIQFETAFGDVVPGDPMRYFKYADEPMCEFWSPFNNAGGFVTSHDFKAVKPCVSAAHLYGKRRVSAESFTSFELTFDESFQELKENANRHFARGVTHIVTHTFTHNPSVEGPPPGSSFGQRIGTPFLRLQPWWPYMRGFAEYLEDCGRMLEEGLPVVDILMYVGDEWGHRPSERDELFGGGCKVDYLNQDALLTRLDVKDGRIVLPDGMSYRVVWIPKGTFTLPETEAKFAELEKKGARIVRGDFKPDWTPDLAWEGEGGLVWYHRRSEKSGDAYFIAATEKGFKGKVKFPMGGGFGNGPSSVDLALARGESRIIHVGCCGTPLSIEPGMRPLRREFKKGVEIPLSAPSIALGGWTDGATDKTYVFRCGPVDGDAVLDLGRVCHWATVKVNGRAVPPRLWSEPYRCRIDQHTFRNDAGNVIEVEVTATVHNRLVLDARLPESERRTWTLSGPEAEASLKPAGLYGPVRLFQIADE